MTTRNSYEDWYDSSPYASYVQERRVVTSTPAVMLDLRQPAGEFPDPPIEEILLIQDKSGVRATCDFGAGRFSCVPGSIAVAPRLSATQVSVARPHWIRCLAFSPLRLLEWTEAPPGQADLGRLHAASLQSEFVHQLMDRIWGHGEVEAGASTLMGDAALLTLWAELLREARTPVTLARGGLAPWQVRRCTDYLNEHACENVGLEELAALVGLSPFHFARAFKHSTGMPPHRYQLSLRIERAKALLALTDTPITAIALDVGYESSQALARLFRREVGVSPSDYRRTRRL